MENFIINPILEKDIPYIAKIMRNRWKYSPEEAFAEAKAHLIQNDEMGGFCIHTHDGLTIGVGLFSIYNEDVSEKYKPWLYLLWIEPEYRGNNFGVLLTQKRMDHARKYGYQKIYLDTVDAAPYHRALGWKEVETIQRNGEKIDIMEWDLSEQFPKKFTD